MHDDILHLYRIRVSIPFHTSIALNFELTKFKAQQSKLYLSHQSGTKQGHCRYGQRWLGWIMVDMHLGIDKLASES